MPGGINGPPIYDGEAYQHSTKTLLKLRTDLMIRLGFAAQLSSPPTGMTEFLNALLIDAQEQMYQRHVPLRNILWWPISIQQGKRFYDIPSISSGSLTDVSFNDNDPAVDDIKRASGSWIDDGFAPGMVVVISGSTSNNLISVILAAVTALDLTLTAAGSVVTEAAGTAVTLTTVGYQSVDERKIKEVWLLDTNKWSPLKDGIDTGRFNETGQSYPQEYEFRSTLEIWPEPDKAYTIYLKGHFGLLPFAADTDTCTIESKLVFLMALASGKVHYGKGDAGTIFRQLEVVLRKYNSADFGSKRYIPNSQVPPALAEPIVTFPRG